MGKPLVIDGFCGLGGWAEGFLAEGYDVIGFDTIRHDYGTGVYPGQLVLQDWLTLDGKQVRNATCIVASPPCQEFSYMAMPWSRAKQIAGALREEVDFPEGYDGSRTLTELTALFDACFRIQREASEAGGRYVPLVVENVKGAQPWVGAAKAHYGSFYLWGDVGSVNGAIAGHKPRFGETLRVRKILKGFGGTWFHNAELGTTNPNRSRTTEDPSIKNTGGSWFGIGSPGQVETGNNPVRFAGDNGRKGRGGNWFGTYAEQKGQGGAQRETGSNSIARKKASAEIAKIPEPLARHIARIYKP